MTAHASDQSGPFCKMSFMGALSGLTMSPRRWFDEAFPGITPREAGAMLLLASLFYAAAGALPVSSTGTLVRGAILMANALGMTVLHSAMAWIVCAVVGGPRLRFASIWMVFAIGTSPTLLIAWIPFTFFFTEPWRWLLVALGMIYGLGLGKLRTVLVLLIAGSLTTMLVLSILRLVASPIIPAW
jgi:hypothetical protein